MPIAQIHAPSGVLTVEDLGTIRRITLSGTVIQFGILKPLQKPVDTRLRFPTIERLIAVKGDWWLDELERRDAPDYIRNRLGILVSRFGSFKDARVLDIGSGSGSSALVMADYGIKEIRGVEIDPAMTDLANLRATDEGVADRVSFLHLEDTTHLPFKDAEFDIVTFNAVIEHIPPALREPILKDAYRCLKPGGLLVVTETPNRAFPYDNHTTWLPLLPWLPLSLSVPLARRFSRRERGMTREQYISAGIAGGSYCRISHAIRGAECLNIHGGDVDMICARKSCGTAFRSVLRFIESIFNLFGLPFTAFAPALDLVYRKPVA
jgi:ubiquinone/menaquinone biosynthesis C-methylase UbiE